MPIIRLSNRWFFGAVILLQANIEFVVKKYSAEWKPVILQIKTAPFFGGRQENVSKSKIFISAF
jgi:hypothetical protein